MEYKILIGIVTFNGELHIEKCIESVLRTKLRNVDIIIVDNNSSDQTLDIAAQYSAVRIILSKKNLGFGRANNILFKIADQENYDFIYLMNQDTYFLDESLKNLIDFVNLDDDGLKIFSPIHLNKDLKSLDKGFEKYLIQERFADNSYKFLNAAAWLIHRSTFNKLGAFNPIFDHYGEDREYANRLLFHKGHFKVCQSSRIVHNREFKAIQKRKTKNYFNRIKMYYFTILTDINKSLATSNLIYGKALLKDYLIDLLELDFKSIIHRTIVVFSIFKEMPRIFHSRSLTKKTKAFI